MILTDVPSPNPTIQAQPFIGVPGIRLQTCPNQDIRVYHFKLEVSEEIATHVGQMRGVCFVHSGRYHLHVEKGVAFEWSEVEPNIIEYLGLMNGIDG